jgi:hypothetical protein
MDRLSLHDLRKFVDDREQFVERKLLHIKRASDGLKYDIARRVLEGDSVDYSNLGITEYAWVYSVTQKMRGCLDKLESGFGSFEVQYSPRWQTEVNGVCLDCSADRVYYCEDKDVLVEYKFGACSVVDWAGYSWGGKRCEMFCVTTGGEARRVKPQDYNDELIQCIEFAQKYTGR